MESQSAASRSAPYFFDTTVQILMLATRETSQIFLPVLKSAGLLLCGLHLMSLTGELAFHSLEGMLRDSEQASGITSGKSDFLFLVFGAALELCFETLWSALWVLCLVWATILANAKTRIRPVHTDLAQAQTGFELPTIPSASKITYQLNQLLIESVRSLAAILFRLPFLILPGLIEYFRLAWVPYVVLLHPGYDRGAIDALAESRNLTRRHFGLVFLALTSGIFVPWLVKHLLGLSSTTPWTAPFSYAAGGILSLLLNVGFGIFLVAIARHLLMIQTLDDRIPGTTDQSGKPNTDLDKSDDDSIDQTNRDDSVEAPIDVNMDARRGR
jgi:hypothetical protein